MTPLDPEEKIFSLSDIKQLFIQKKVQLLCSGFFLGIICVCYTAMHSPQYKVEATFRDHVEKKESNSFMSDVLSNLNGGGESSQIVALMKSNQVLKPLVNHLGLQVQIASNSSWQRKLCRIRDILFAEFGCPLGDVDSFRFSNVTFEGEKPLKFKIIFISPNRFIVDYEQNKIEGQIEEEIHVEHASFCIKKVPHDLQIGFEYAGSIQSWVTTVQGLRNSVKIVSQKLNKTIYELSIESRDRWLATEIINSLMEEYRHFLKRDHDQVAVQQLSYLEERQEDLFHTIGRALDEHVSFLQSNVAGNGFISVEQETEAFMKPYEQLFSRTFSADIEMEELSRCQHNPAPLFDGESKPFAAMIQQIDHNVQDLENQRDLILAALYFHRTEDCNDSKIDENLSYEKQLQLVRCDLVKTNEAIKDLEASDQLPLQLDLFHDPDLVVQSWAKRIHENQYEKGDLVLYLHNLSHLFSVREKVLQDRQFHPKHASAELDGIDVDTAKKLLIETSHKLDASKVAIQHYRHLIDQVQKPDFETSSLSAVLQDPVSQQLLASAAKLHFEIEDQNNYSEKESERNRRENQLQRRIFQDHLKQLVMVEELNRSIFQDKIISLQEISLDCLNRQICVGNERIALLSQKRKEMLVHEKILLEKKMQELRSKMNDLPIKWRAENLLKLKTDLGIKIMQSVTQLVESKTIGEHLHQIESKPLDVALPPLAPKSPHLVLFFVLGGSLGIVGAFFGLFLKTLYRGFPVRSDTLLALRYPFAGSISTKIEQLNFADLSDQDLEAMRKILVKLDEMPQAKCIGLFAGNGPNFSHALAHLTAKGNQKILLINTDFSTKISEKEEKGLIQFIDGMITDCPIQIGKNYDYLPSGGVTRFGLELLRSPRFSLLLKQLAPSYDRIFLLNRASFDSAESSLLLSFNQAAIVSITNEPIELLTPFIQWAYYEGRCRLTFLVASCSS